MNIQKARLEQKRNDANQVSNLGAGVSKPSKTCIHYICLRLLVFVEFEILPSNKYNGCQTDSTCGLKKNSFIENIEMMCNLMYI